MLKIGVQVQTHKDGRVKVNEWKTVIEPVALADLDDSKLRGLNSFKARLIFQVENPNDAKVLGQTLEQVFSGSSLHGVLTSLHETFAHHPES